MEKKIKRILKIRLLIKYISLCLLIFSAFLLIVALVATICNTAQIYIITCLIMTPLLFGGVILAFIYSLQLPKLPKINNKSDLNDYLEIITSQKYNFMYIEYITWFSWLLEDEYHKKNIYDKDNNDELIDLLNKLYSFTLRVDPSNNLCYAASRRQAFKSLADKIRSKNYKDEDFEYFTKTPKTKKTFNTSVYDKGILFYLIILILHVIADFFLSTQENELLIVIIYKEIFKSDSNNNNIFNIININQLIGNILISIPTDILAIFIYRGIIKERKQNIK